MDDGGYGMLECLECREKECQCNQCSGMPPPVKPENTNIY